MNYNFKLTVRFKFDRKKVSDVEFLDSLNLKYNNGLQCDY